MNRKYLLWPIHLRFMPKVRMSFGKRKIDELRYNRNGIQYLAWDFMLGKLLISFGR